MPITPTYPGVYIEEPPSPSHTILAAPTSITAFVGYTHPLKTPQPTATPTPPAPAIQLFSFADYQANFGGFFDSPWLPDYVGPAVFQFFNNGGSSAYVVGLTNPSYPAATVSVPTTPDDVVFTAREPVATSGPPPTGIPMTISISNVQKTKADDDTADIVISYGRQVETYRRVLISNLSSALAGSQLVSVAAPATPPTAYPTSGSPFPLKYASTPGTSLIDFPTIAAVFTDNFPLDKVTIFNLLVVPGITDPTVLSAGVAYAERKRAFYIMDSPKNWDVDTPANPAATGLPASAPESPIDGLRTLPVPVSTNAAIYFPWLATTDPISGAPSTSPPSGFVAGVYARQDADRGVWKSPAGLETVLNGSLGVVPTGVMTDNQQGVLNGVGINALRQFPSLPPVVFGARTLAYRDPSLRDQWGYVAVRRMALFLEQSLYANLPWAVFEPNDAPLWNALTQEVGAFMMGLFRQGAFAGTKPSEAFLVQCDSTTTTQDDINKGIVNILVAFAPLRPAEFVVIQIAQLAGQDRTFETWANAAQVLDHGAPATSLANLRQEVSITLLNEEAQPVLRWLVHRCWVSEYQALPDLDAGSNTVAIEHIKLENEGWERDTALPEPVEL